MEFLVDMTTRVPDGATDSQVQDIRAREARRSRELASQGHLLRLWRPPLQPGEWRTVGLFSAADSGDLEDVLASMPLRVWRTDDVTPLMPHPNDPAGPAGQPAASAPPDAGTEFLTRLTVTVPAGTPAETVRSAEAREADRARELATDGHLVRLWALPGERRTLGLWRDRSLPGLQAILAELPLNHWMSVDTTPLSPHPSDPGQPGP